MDPSDSELVRQCLDGHPEQYRHLVLRYQVALRAYLSGRLGNYADAEDAAQEVFVRAYRSLSNLHKADSFFAYLLGTAGRVCLECHRGQLRQRKIVEAATTLASQSPDPPPEPDEALHRGLSSLPEPYQQVILLRYYAGLSCSDIAQQCGMPLGTVTKNLSRAYSLLRQSLSQPSRTPVTTQTR